MDLSPYKLIVFDLDNTLYKETDYLFSAYRELAKKCALRDEVNEETLYEFLVKRFRESGRGGLFDSMVEKFQLKHTELIDCLSVLRQHKLSQKIKLISPAKELMSAQISAGKKVCVLTNGNPEQQRNKVRQIDWEGMDSDIHFVYANEIEKKPSPAGLIHISEMMNVTPAQMLMIGDSQEDRESAENAGVAFADIKAF
jgi:HAD superfamily hydrolase (TIGR01549 family)